MVETERLSRIRLLAELNPAELELVRAMIVERNYAPGEIIFVEGEPSVGLWFVTRGRVRLFKTAPSGRELTVCIASAEQKFCLGTCPLFDGERHPVSGEALDEVTLYFINRQLANQAASENPAVARALGRMLGERFRYFSHLVTSLGLHCVKVRLAKWLLDYAEKHGRPSGGGIEIKIEVNQETVATMLGTDRAVVARTLLQFEQSGAIEAHGRQVIIKDRQKLAALARV